LLLDLLEAHSPVAQWATRPGMKRERSRRSREDQRNRAADQDRHNPRNTEMRTGQGGPEQQGRTHHDHVHRQAAEAVDAERTRRRQALSEQGASAPTRLGDAYRRRSLFALPDPDPGDEPGAGAPEEPPDSTRS
ncbi:hypothetical protein ACFRPV_38540, partial [Kitasatospora sp. NPDC056808]